MSKSLCWKVGDGMYVQVGIDPMVGLENTFNISRSLTDYLQDFGIKTLNQARIGCDLETNGSYWFSVEDLDLTGDWYLEWEKYVSSLLLVGLHLSEAEYMMVWSFNVVSIQIIAKLAYGFLVDSLDFGGSLVA